MNITGKFYSPVFHLTDEEAKIYKDLPPCQYLRAGKCYYLDLIPNKLCLFQGFVLFKT